MGHHHPVKLATLCYLEQEGKVLMLHRVKKDQDLHQGKWNGVGGTFEPGESPEECARREIEEETGYIPQKMHLKGTITFPGFDGEHDWYVFVYTVSAFIGELKESEEGALHWIEKEKVYDLNLWEGDRDFLPWVFAETHPFFSAKFFYVNMEYRGHEVEFYG